VCNHLLHWRHRLWPYLLLQPQAWLQALLPLPHRHLPLQLSRRQANVLQRQARHPPHPSARVPGSTRVGLAIVRQPIPPWLAEWATKAKYAWIFW
jgi:hypothetical protein